MLLQVFNVGLVGSNFSSDCLGKIPHILHLDSTNVILLAIFPFGAVGGGTHTEPGRTRSFRQFVSAVVRSTEAV
jgi:hypothetical protein